MQQGIINQQTVNILLVEDHEIVRWGMKLALETGGSVFQFRVTEAERGEVAFAAIAKKNFDLAIVDYRLPGINGDEVIRKIKAEHPQMKILAISLYDDPDIVQSMISAGADGYILKNVESSQLLHAVRIILRGEKYYCSEVAVKLLEMEKENSRVRNLYDRYGLTQREIEILGLIAREKTNEDISKQLFISKRTVDTHRQNLLHKLQVKNTAGLVVAAVELRLI